MKEHVQHLVSAPTLIFFILLSLAMHDLPRYRLVFRNRILIGLQLTVFRLLSTIEILITIRDLIVRLLIVI